MWDYRASVLRVKDGDTLRVRIDRGFAETREIDLRLGPDVYAPEKRQPGGLETRDFVDIWVDAYSEGEWPFVVTLQRTKRGDREAVSLGRYIGTLTTPDGECLGQAVNAFIAEHGYGHGTGAR
ncbi:hypothetical protein ACFYW9_19350 [Streptomyces sp. NPDC002698]|uniref:hypothetical protein n=1 Tax=Streptomyces sp. NPDC002698 TaxID=3364660 RepID=UPI003695FB8D